MLSGLRPQLDLINLDWAGLVGEVDSSSVAHIRTALRGVFSRVMEVKLLFRVVFRFYSFSYFYVPGRCAG